MLNPFWYLQPLLFWKPQELGQIPMNIPTKCGCNCPSGFREEVKTDNTLLYTCVPLVSFVNFRSAKNLIFLEDHPVNILTKSGSNRPNCFKRRRLKCKSVQTMMVPKWSHYSLSPELKRWCSHACFRTTLYVIWNNTVLMPILERAESSDLE